VEARRRRDPVGIGPGHGERNGDGFRRLDPQEQTAAYLEIEAAWKALQAEAEPAPEPPPIQSRRSRGDGQRSVRPRRLPRDCADTFGRLP
jgi:hypothetical protein